ncbi:MAG: LytTR family transcriptional regulator DNA-binding domain-containing protein [Candidatus Firestonebacteria bacterium]|nr:LytTR family transcriptional regulator DNA-binding domain-containing protein [Candidatus Firestonebacteria bacterium]
MKISAAIPKAPQYLQWIEIQSGDGVILVSVNINYIIKASRTFTNRYDIKLKDIPETLTVSRPYIHLFKQM